MLLIPDQSMKVVFAGEARSLVVLVLPDSGGEVAGNAYVQGAIGFIGKDVNAGMFQLTRDCGFPLSSAWLLGLRSVCVPYGYSAWIAASLCSSQ